MIRVPWRGRFQVRVDCELRPVGQFLLDDFSRRFRHQTEGISREIDEGLAVLAEREMKFVAKVTQWIAGIELTREILFNGESQGHIERESFATDEHGSNTDPEAFGS